MRKVILFNMVTVDGYFEGPKKWDIAWHQTDNEFNDFSIEQLNQAGGLIFGRVTYEGMASYWKSSSAFEDDPGVAQLMNALPKFVFSKTLDRVDWNHTQLLNGVAEAELKKLKMQAGKDLFVFGSADLSSTFIKHNLFDEYRLIINPIVLGRGVPLFKVDGEPRKLNLLSTRSFQNGNVLLSYTPEFNPTIQGG